MRKTKLKKLELCKETLKNLEDRRLGQVVAAVQEGTTDSGVWCSQYWTQCFCME